MCSRFLLSLCLVTSISTANQTALDFQRYKDFAKSLNEQPKNAMEHFHPQAIFEQYSEHPKSEQFYQGVEGVNTNLSAAASIALKEDVVSKKIIEQFGNSKFEINKNNTAIKESELIQDNSYAITHGISNEKVHCNEEGMSCEVKSHDEVCQSSRQLPDQTCTKERKVTVSSEKIHQQADFSFIVGRKWTGFVTVNLFTGAMTNVYYGSMPHPIALNHACGHMSVSIHSIVNNQEYAYWVRVVGLPSCSNNGLMTLYINREWDRRYPIYVALTVDATSTPYVAEEHWENHCDALDNDLCHVKNERCKEGNTTKVIDGLSITRDCWEKEALYSCSSAKVDECRVQKEKGCLQISSTCARYENNFCALYRQVYSCQETVCQPSAACLKDVFCADGECTQHLSTQNNEFAKSVAPLAVTGEAGREIGQGQVALFAGSIAQCKIWPLHVIDCCDDKGWGKDIDLLHCRDEDKALGEAKLNYVAHYLGEFCSKSVLGECVEHKRTYCVFPSKMARIIQEARLDQLGMLALGDAENPICGGLSVAELQNMDLSRIDLIAPIYPYGSGMHDESAGIAKDFGVYSPDSSKTIEEIKRRIQKNAGKL